MDCNEVIQDLLFITGHGNNIQSYWIEPV